MIAEVVFLSSVVGDTEAVDAVAFAGDFEGVALIAGIDDFDISLS